MANPSSRASRGFESDPSWYPLYRAAAVAAALTVILYVVALLMYVVTPAPPLATAGGAATLDYVAGERGIYIIRQLLWLTPSLFLMVVVLALAVSLYPLGKSAATIAGVIAISSWAVSFGWPTTGEGSLAMVVLSDRYLTVTTDAERAVFIAGAEVLLALNDAQVVIGVLQTLGILLLSALMLRGVFPTGLAWLGVATGGIGIISEALRPLLGWAYAVYGLLLFGWLIWVAIALWRLGIQTVSPSAAPPSHGNHQVELG